MLKIENISKTFNPGTINEKVALQDLSLHLAPGDFVTIIGSNGAGKSTLFNAICGSFFTDSGSIYLDGRNITFLPEYQRSRQIGRLFQDPMRGSAPHMTIEENLSLAAASGGWLSHVTRAEKAAFREKLAQLDMGLEDRMRQPVGLLSGGQRQALTLLFARFAPPTSGVAITKPPSSRRSSCCWMSIPPPWTPPQRKRSWRSPVGLWRKTASPPLWSPTICTRPWSWATAP